MERLFRTVLTIACHSDFPAISRTAGRAQATDRHFSFSAARDCRTVAARRPRPDFNQWAASFSSLIEYDGLSGVLQNSMLQMPLDCARQYDALEIAAFPHQILHLITM